MPDELIEHKEISVTLILYLLASYKAIYVITDLQLCLLNLTKPFNFNLLFPVPDDSLF